MNRETTLRIALITVTALAVIGAIAGCHDKGTEPEPAKYSIYVGGAWSNQPVDSRVFQFYLYDADSLTLSDSIPYPAFAAYMEVSPDGRWLYAAAHSWHENEPSTVSKINARTGDVIWTREGLTWIQLLKRGQLLLRAGCGASGEVLDSESGEVVTRLPDSLCSHAGPVSGTKVAVVVTDGSNRIRVTDVLTGEIYGNYLPQLSSGQALNVRYAALHPDGRRVLAIGFYANLQYSWFVIGDVQTGETLLEHRLVYPYGEIAISADGCMAAVTDPGLGLIYDSFPTLDLFDLDEMIHVKRFQYNAGLAWFGQVRFLPGDQRIIVAPPADGLGGGPLHVVDLQSLTITDTIWVPNNNPDLSGGLSTGALAVGPSPER